MVPLTIARTPYVILLELEYRSLAVETKMAEGKETSTWSGIPFFVNSHLVLVSLHDVQEIVDCPLLTHIPRTKK